MKKHVKSKHFILLNDFLEDATTMAPRSSPDCEPNKKKAHVSPIAIFCFFILLVNSKKNVATQMGFVEDFLLFVVKGLLPMRIIESIWL
jgi:hypothetical protein